MVIYSYASGTWWVQPFASTPITPISEDGSWEAHIHLGTKYAALLSRADTLPTQLLEADPAVSKTVDAVAVVNARGLETMHPDTARIGPTVRFSGLDWKVRVIPGDYTAKTNNYSSDNVSVDESGALHLRLTQDSTGWVCSEIHSVRSLGYGSYNLEVRNVSNLEPAVMFSAFTYYQDPKDTDHRELDIHVTRRGVPTNTNAEFIVQPAHVPRNFYHFSLPSGGIKLGLDWQRDEAKFSVSRGHVPASPPATSWLFRTGVPKPDDTHLYINLCTFGFAPTPPTHNAEVIVDAFNFYP